MDWLKDLGAWVWSALGLLAGLAVFTQFAIPLGSWFWGFAETHALTLIALAVLGGIAGYAAHTHSSNGS